MRFFVLAIFASLCFAAPHARSKNELTAYFIDVEGGQATLVVTPEGESVLIDAGWPGNDGRDASRIAEVAKVAKVSKIDFFVLTHYHVDHAGGVPQLVAKLPVGVFVDHGPSRETATADQQRLFHDYERAIAGSHHMVVKPGDRLPLHETEATVVSADGELIAKPMPTGGNANTFCAATATRSPDMSENARSLGTYWHFGSFRMVDLGDLTWNKEKELMCPVNRLGKADVFVVSHHGLDQSNSPALVHDLAPRVAIEDNGAGKGGSIGTYNVLKTTLGLEDIWQLHFSEDGGARYNTIDTNIANLAGDDAGHYLKLTASEDGSFTVYNSRNKFTQTYSAKTRFGNYRWETR